MKILHLCADWKWTGPAEPMLHAVTGLRARGHEVDLVCPPGPSGSKQTLLGNARERGVEPPLLLARARGVRVLRDRGVVRELRELIRDNGYEVVHVHHARDHVLARRALGSRRKRASALVASWHHASPVPLYPANRWLLGPRSTDGLCVLGDAIAAHARKGLGFPSECVVVLPGVVDVNRFQPRPPDPDLCKEFGLGAGQTVIGVVARLQPHRRFELLLEAFRQAVQVAPELRLMVVGRGTRAHEVLHAPVERLGLGESVIAAGYRGPDFASALGVFDALVFLVPGSDGSCRAVLEAMAMGVPVIASRRGVLPQIVESGSTGLVISEQEQELRDALVDVARNHSEWAARGKAARERALLQHTVPLYAERLERFYVSICGPTS